MTEKALAGGAQSRETEPVTHDMPASFFRSRLPELAFTLVALCIWGMVKTDYGISWDETVDLRFGEAVREYFAGGLNDEAVAHFPVENLKFYSPAVALLAATLAHFTGGNIYFCGAAISGLFWAATFWPVCALGRQLAGNAGAWLSGLALLCMPTYLGHAFINMKDIPMACSTAWMALTSASVARRKISDWKVACILGTAYGLVLAVRPGGWFVGALLGLPLLNEIWPLRRGRRLEETLAGLLRGFGVVAAAILLAWAIMVTPWPYAHRGIFTHPIEGMLYAGKFNEVYPVMFGGQPLPSNALPWTYYFVYFGLTTPLAVLGFFLLGNLTLARNVWRGGKEFAPATAVLFLCWFPMACFLALRMNVYDGIRHFLFVVPMMAVAAGAGAAWLAERLPVIPWPRLRYGAVALALATAIPSLIRFHPYQYVYYNILAGPRKTLHERYETDYWVTSYRQAAEWINQTAAKRDRPTLVLVAANSFCLPAFANFASSKIRIIPVMGNYQRAPWPTEADYFVGTVRYGQWRNLSIAPVVHQIKSNDVLLSVIRGRP